MPPGVDEHLEILIAARGGMQTLAEFRAVATGAVEADAALDRVGRTSVHTAKRGFLMNQMLFTARRLLYGVTLAAGAGAAGVIAFGLKFDAALETNTNSLTYFLHSSKRAKKELDFLFNLAAETPFEFQQVTDAARKFLSFGFTLKQTNEYLQILGDTAAGLGKTGPELDHLSVIIGQIHTTGRLLGGDVLQLEQFGINVPHALRKYLNITREQLKHGIGRLQIPAGLAIQAIMAEMKHNFKGMSAIQAQSLTGLLSTLHDYAGRFAGVLDKPIFDWLKRKLPKINDALAKATKIQSDPKHGGFGAVIRSLDTSFHLSGKLNNAWIGLRDTTKNLFKVLRELWISFMTVMDVFGGFTSILKIGSVVIAALAWHTWLLRPALEMLITYLIISRTWLLANAAAAKVLFIWEKEVAIWTGIVGLVTGKSTKAQKLNVFWTKASAFAQKGYKAALQATVVWTKLATVAAWEFTVALLSNPLTWLVIALLAVVITFAILYFKVKRFHDWVNKHWPLLLAILAIPFLGLLPLIVYTLVKYRRAILGFFVDIGRDVAGVFVGLWRVSRKVFNWIYNKILSIVHVLQRLVSKVMWVINKLRAIHLPGLGSGGGGGGFFHSLTHPWEQFQHPTRLLPYWPGAAHGGVVTKPGFTLVGEHGPELRYLPARAEIIPLSQGSNLTSGRGGKITIEVPVYLNSRQIARSVAEVDSDQYARL